MDNSASAVPTITKREKLWSNDERNAAPYAITGTNIVTTPMINFSKSLTTADILPLAVVLKKRMISKMLAEATDIIMKKGIRTLENEVKGFTKDKATNANGTGT